jgi:uroporphyrinogen III methyltransferase/synthase
VGDEQARTASARPLAGKRVAVLRAREQGSSAVDLLRERGAEPIFVPLLVITPPRDAEPLRRVLAHFSVWDCVAFTSANGVERTFEELARQGRDAAAFGRAKIAAIGPATAAALRARGVEPHVVAKESQGEGLAAELLATLHAGAKVLVLRALVAREVLPDALRAAGCHVDIVAVYETHPPSPEDVDALVKRLEQRTLDAILLTSGSTVTHLCDALGARAAELLANVCLASIGPVTTKAAETLGFRVAVAAESPTMRGLVDALEAHFGRR